MEGVHSEDRSGRAQEHVILFHPNPHTKADGDFHRTVLPHVPGKMLHRYLHQAHLGAVGADWKKKVWKDGAYLPVSGKYIPKSGDIVVCVWGSHG